MPLWKTLSNTNKQVIKPKTWTTISFNDVTEFKLPRFGWSIMTSIIRVFYPSTGCPTTVKIRLVRYPNTNKEDLTGHSDYDPLPNNERHIHWQHFILNRKDLTVSLRIWHNGKNPIILDGRQFKTTRFK